MNVPFHEGRGTQDREVESAACEILLDGGLGAKEVDAMLGEAPRAEV